MRRGLLLALMISSCGGGGGGPPLTDRAAPLADAASSDASAEGRARDGLAQEMTSRTPDGRPALDRGTPSPDAASPPGCVTAAQCGAGRGCLAGICRDPCFLGAICAGTASGNYCQQGLCVQCTVDSHCPGTRYTCDQKDFTCKEKPFDPKLTKLGLFYLLWHCPAANSTPIYDISNILAGTQSWGPYQKFHYWDEPSAGYYCLSQNDALLDKHAQQISDAGIDFVFLDMTNHAYTDGRSDSTKAMILDPLDRLLAVWSKNPKAPLIVPWVPVVEPGTDPNQYTVDAVAARFKQYPSLQFKYLGKPLLLVTENSQYPASAAKLAALAQSFTVRKMWAMFGSPGPEWSFLQACKGSPTLAQPCAQRSAVLGGALEQVSITAAYQATYMSNTQTATPKHQGKTFRKQFETLFLNPQVPIATITGWNEWIAQRQPCGQNAACPCATYPNGCFIDQWDLEYNRDIEPGKNQMGDYYYQLLKSCVSLFRKGQMCTVANAGDLCCHDWSP